MAGWRTPRNRLFLRFQSSVSDAIVLNRADFMARNRNAKLLGLVWWFCQHNHASSNIGNVSKPLVCCFLVGFYLLSPGLACSR